MSNAKKLRDLKPKIVDVNSVGRPDPRFKRVKFQVPAKLGANTKGSMDLQALYTHGPLKNEAFGKVCGTCVYYYPDPNLKPHHGRCRFYGYKQVAEELSANVEHNYTEPDGQFTFNEWPGCPTWTSRERMSRK